MSAITAPALEQPSLRIIPLHEDEQLVQWTLDGEVEYFGYLVRRYTPSFQRVAKRILKNEQDAQGDKNNYK